MKKQRKIIARAMENGIEVVRYEGDPPHRWYRVTPLTAAEKIRDDKVANQLEAELRDQGLLPEKELVSALGRQLRAVRHQSALSLDELAKRAGMEKSALSRLESGKNPNPSVQTIQRIAQALGRGMLVSFPVRRKPA